MIGSGGFLVFLPIRWYQVSIYIQAISLDLVSVVVLSHLRQLQQSTIH